ncbi:MAG: DUF1961 family protein, partial [Phycisphaeraceae bacterium]
MSDAQATSTPSRWLSPDSPYENVVCDGPFRELTMHGRTGVNATSIHSTLRFDAPQLNAPRGTLSLWLLPLEELSTQANIPHIKNFQADYQAVPVLTDHAELRNVNASTFAMTFFTNWYPHFYVKRTRGGLYSNAYKPTGSAVVGLGHFPVQRETWYHLAYTWDHEASDYCVYINGVLAGTSIQHKQDMPLRHEPAGQTLYAGHPRLLLSEIQIDNEPLRRDELRQRIASDPTTTDPDVQRELERIYEGVGVPRLDWEAPGNWKTVLDLPLTGPDALNDFYVQSHRPSMARTSDEGIRVQTPFTRTPKPDDWDQRSDEPFDADQIYLWLERFFEGDLHLRYEFKSRSDRGLCLLAAQASGMHGEDFMLDHPRRTTGSMRMVFGENVRNYHWEYYRHMSDTRHDVASSGLIKQPWQWPLAYQCLDHTLALEQWHTLDFIHVGDRLLGALDDYV